LAGVLTGESFDVIICHAVLEWLADPQDALGRLSGLLKADGLLSLMFYNRNASLLKR
jgi:S-adenosylmethionine-dependent methyltransferase